MGWLIDSRSSLLAVLEAGKSMIQALADLVSGERLPPGRAWTAVCPHAVEGVRKFSRVSVLRALTPLKRAPPS